MNHSFVNVQFKEKNNPLHLHNYKNSHFFSITIHHFIKNSISNGIDIIQQTKSQMHENENWDVI